MQEAGDLDTEWRSVATDIRTSDYTVKNISPRKDYRFRIRAQTENGDVSEPTPPIQFYRTRVPLLKDSENALAEFKPVEYKAIFLKHPYYEQLTKYVPPTMPIHKPDMIIIDQETVELSWRPAIVAEAIRGQCNLTYTIEVRCPPSFEWRQLVTGLKVCSHTVQKLHPRIDYIFRVRAWNEYGCSDAGLPVSLYRPAVYKIEGEDLDDEEFEKEWERKYGTKDIEKLLQEVPPKLPIDTPRIVTQTSDSIWFTWLPARIPAYATQTNISYVVEIKEPPSTAWQRDAADLVDCQYVKEGLNPNQEYHIRVRAETEFGPSDATMPIIIRGKGSRSGSRRSSVEREERSMDDKIDLSYLDNVMAGVPPRMASSRPLSSSVGPDKLTLTWSPCRTPSYVKASSVTYIIEKREPPGHVWTVLAKDITGHKFEITGLNPEQDYMFRVRARNEFGLSDPTLPMTLFRDRDDYVPPRIRSRSSSRDSISLLVSKHMRRSASIDYNIQPMEDDRSSQERIPCQPQYITTTFDTQYGVLGKKGKIQLEVRGYPLPTVHWYKGEEKIEYGGQYNAFVTPSGGITLEIKNVGLDTVGQFKCYAENGSGAAVKMVTFELAEPPTVLETIKDISLLKGESATLSCRVDGFPSPTVKWMKDWRPLADCTRTKMVNIPPETYNLEIMQLIEEDDGLYACTVENMAGKVTVTGRLRVEIDSFPEREINIRSSPIEEHYHVLEEIGRGRYGVVRRVIEISTGRTFAANFMSMRNKAQKHFFMNEFEVLRSISKMDGVLKLYDAFETERSLIFVTEILSEPELLEKIITDGSWTEARVAAIIKKLLAIFQELAQLNILHLDIKPSNIRMCGADLDDIKLLGFGLSRVLQSEEDITHNYGSVGYASPEQVTNEALKPNTDLWSVGVLSYLLLSGNGPFTGSSEVEILKYMAENSWTFEGQGFDKFSKEGLDFINKLLVKDPSKRMTIEECMSHPWLSTTSDTKINTEQLKQFYNAEKLQRQTEKVFTTVQLQSFAKIIHGAKALYQPAVDIESGEIIFPDSELYGDYLDEDAWYEWQLQYQDDPDSQIFPIQDKKFTVRECRHAGAPKYTTPKQMERADKDILDTGTGILFRDKIQATTFLVGEDVTFTAKVVSETGEIPVVTWYRDEQLLSDDYRADASYNPETGLAKLKIIKSKDYDAAVYKCVARIKEGRVSCEARLLLGDVPSKPGRPLVTQTSGTEAFLTWTGPVSDGNAYLLGYRVDYRKEGEKKWTQGPYVTEEYALLSGLVPNTTYIFRVSVHNRYGASPFSWSSLETRTLAKDAPKVAVAMDLQPLMQFLTFDKQQLILPAESRRPSLTVAEEPKINESDPNEIFTFADTISKGSYGEYKLCTNKSTNQQCVAKIVPYNKDKHADITAEFELLRTLSQANVVSVLDSYISADQFYVIYEHLSGINIVQYFCLHKAYKEETVACLVRQVLDALQYLEHFGIVHLNLQPTSMVMATRRRPHVKLRDFTLAHKVEDDKGVKVPLAGFPDFTPPEILKGENVNFTADLWTLGAVTFTLMSGISPFGGKNLEETLSRILFDRYSTKEMYDNVTPESVKFVVKLLSRLPRNRPTVTKCLNSSWLNLGESMVNARNSRMFKSEKLRAFSVDYLAKRSDIDYNLAVVDIEKLPKISTGPLIQPILSDKITNRLENITKVKKQPDNLYETLKNEVSNLPEQPLLEKLVCKIEKDTKIEDVSNLPEQPLPEELVSKIENDTVIEDEFDKKEPDTKEKIVTRIANDDSSIIEKEVVIPKQTDLVDGASFAKEETKSGTDVEEVATAIQKAGDEKKEAKILGEVESIKSKKNQVEEATIQESVVIDEAKKTDVIDQVENTDASKKQAAKDTKEMKRESQESMQLISDDMVEDIDTEKDVKIIESKATETLLEANADISKSCKIETLTTEVVKGESKTEKTVREKIEETIGIECKESKIVAETSSEDETKMETVNMNNTETLEKSKAMDAEKRDTNDKVKSPDAITQKQKDSQVVDSTTLEKVENIQKNETEQKEIMKRLAVEDQLDKTISKNETENEQPDKVMELADNVNGEKMNAEDKLVKQEANSGAFDKSKEDSDKLTEVSKEGFEDQAVEKVKEMCDVNDQAQKEQNESTAKLGNANNEIESKDSLESSELKDQVSLSDKQIEQTENVEIETKDKLFISDMQNVDKSKEQTVSEKIQNENKEVEISKSDVMQSTEINEVNEEKIESIKIDKKEVISSKSEEVVSDEFAKKEDGTEIDVISKVAESAVEEIKDSATEKVTSSLEASEDLSPSDVKSSTRTKSPSPISEEKISPEVKISSDQNESVQTSPVQEDRAMSSEQSSFDGKENITGQEKTKSDITSTEASNPVSEKDIETSVEQINVNSESEVEKLSSESTDGMVESEDSKVKSNTEYQASSVSTEQTASSAVSKSIKEEISIPETKQSETGLTVKSGDQLDATSSEETCTEIVSETETKRTDSEVEKAANVQMESGSAEQTTSVDDLSTCFDKDTKSVSETKQEVEREEKQAESKSEVKEIVEQVETQSESSSETEIKTVVEKLENKAESMSETKDTTEKVESQSVSISQSEITQTVEKEESRAESISESEIKETAETRTESVSAEQVSNVENISISVSKGTTSESEIKKKVSFAAEDEKEEKIYKPIEQQSSFESALTDNALTEPEKNEIESISQVQKPSGESADVSLVKETILGSEIEQTAKQAVSSVESASVIEAKEMKSETNLENAEVQEPSEKQVSECTASSSNDENISSISATEGTLSSSVVEEIDGVLTKTVSVTKKQETVTSDGETVNELQEVSTLKTTSESVKQESSSIVENTKSSEVSITQKQETLTSGEESVPNTESLSTVSLTKEEQIQESTNVESSETQDVSSEHRQETLIAGNMVADLKEDLAMVGASVVEESLVTSAVSSSLETAKVTESRETIREFITNDLDIEEMKKELLEDMEISSADCGKYLMGSHEDLSAIKEKVENKPDEEEIEKETTNRYIDDALMFC